MVILEKIAKKTKAKTNKRKLIKPGYKCKNFTETIHLQEQRNAYSCVVRVGSRFQIKGYERVGTGVRAMVLEIATTALMYI